MTLFAATLAVGKGNSTDGHNIQPSMHDALIFAKQHQQSIVILIMIEFEWCAAHTCPIHCIPNGLVTDFGVIKYFYGVSKQQQPTVE